MSLLNSRHFLPNAAVQKKQSLPRRSFLLATSTHDWWFTPELASWSLNKPKQTRFAKSGYGFGRLR